MNYNSHLESICGNKEIADELFRALMKQLNAITHNGKSKLQAANTVFDGNDVILHTSGFDTLTGAIKPATYWLKISKKSEARLD